MVALKTVVVILLLNITSKTTFRIKGLSEDKSFEHLIYYKDFEQLPMGPQLESRNKILEVPPTTSPKPICPCPKMCCTMCCECDAKPRTSFMSRQMSPIQQPKMESFMMHSEMSPEPPQSMQPLQPPQSPQSQIQQKKILRKKMMRARPWGPPPTSPRQNPFMGPTRRDQGTTKEHIKGLISQDEDIKKILKDLVRVTIMKVNQMEIAKDTKTVRQKQKTDNTIQDSDDDETE